MELTNKTSQLILLNINPNYSFPIQAQYVCSAVSTVRVPLAYILYLLADFCFWKFCMDCAVDLGNCWWISRCLVQSNRWSLITILRWLFYKLFHWLQLYALLKFAVWANVNWLKLIRTVCIFSKMYELCLSVGFLWTRQNGNSIFCVGHTRWDCTLWMKLRIHPNL